ncbi:MAG TPA: hypothetical protein VG796_00305 [Verrucomicrobiales bacterium]|jgi:hypothetical protein|nr:hypothetical protein [Verrucomicrobiales bacterium]
MSAKKCRLETRMPVEPVVFSPEALARMERMCDDGLDEVREAVCRKFKPLYPIHDFYILSQFDVDFRAYVFFEEKSDLESSKTTGIQQEIFDFVFAELERIGRGDRSTIKVAFEFDTYENLKKNFGGNYFNRLR